MARFGLSSLRVRLLLLVLLAVLPAFGFILHAGLEERLSALLRTTKQLGAGDHGAVPP